MPEFAIDRPRRSPRAETVPIRGLRYRVHHWGDAEGTPVVLLHGWADTGLTFQFLVDELPPGWRFIAPDWRGFGDTDRAVEGYWFPDYVADLDALMDHYCPGAQVTLVAHSMGGNVATLYAGARPQRVSRIVNIEGFGLMPPPPTEAPARLRQWLDELRAPPQFRVYPSMEHLVRQVCQQHPRLPPARARYVARTWSNPQPDGSVVLKADPRHRIVNPILYRPLEYEACIGAAPAPVLLVVGAESWVYPRFIAPEAIAARVAGYRRLRQAVIAEAGHMLHCERPRELADLIVDFERDTRTTA
jgi:pimeloyl-ACP methyl ester carboxylesterase